MQSACHQESLLRFKRRAAYHGKAGYGVQIEGQHMTGFVFSPRTYGRADVPLDVKAGAQIRLGIVR
jgi:hypothetical protein